MWFFRRKKGISRRTVKLCRYDSMRKLVLHSSAITDSYPAREDFQDNGSECAGFASLGLLVLYICWNPG